MNNFTKRIIFGSIYVAMVVSSVVIGNPWFVFLMALFTLLAILESIKLNNDQASRNKELTALVYSGIIVYLALYQPLDQFTYHYLIMFVLHLSTVFFIRKSMLAKGRSSLLFDTLYIWLPLFALAIHYTQAEGQAVNDILFLFVIIWCADSFAYVSGKLFGKHPIFPETSPKKTWEGTIGGAVLSVLAVFIIQKFWFQLDFNMYITAGIIVISSISGDYLQSFYKRRLGVKDSGSLIPGHGGILDRIDSILFSSLPYLTYVHLIAEK
ncbi:phosphatidate cytidylyltransferase [bacterium]|nr:phosphatidate cytidylyltransferase [bacterium]